MRILVILLAVLVSSCSGLIKSGSQTLLIESSPSDAMVYMNGNEQGTTPYTYTYSKDHGNKLEFEVRKPGYSSSAINVRAKRNNTLLFADAMLFHIPYIVDSKSKSMYSMPVSDVSVQLFKEYDENVERQLLPITTVIVGMDNSVSLGTVNGARVTRGTDNEKIFADLKYSDQLTNYIVSGLRPTWLDCKTIKKGTTNGDEAIRMAKIYMSPTITNVNTTLIRKGKKFTGPMVLDIEWNFYSSGAKDSVLFKRTTHTTYNAQYERGVDIMGVALGQAARLMAEDTTLNRVMKANYTSGISATKGERYELIKPAPITFDGRREMLAALVKAVVTITTEDGHGSGFLITNDGYMLTNAHVMGDETAVKVKFEQGFTLDGQLVKLNKDFDLALVKVPATDLPALLIGNDKDVMLGEEIFAIGTPLDAKLGQSVSRGVLSGQREIDGRNYLQTDVTINPGNSGGPFLNENGKVVGIATMKISGKGVEGLGFGVPISVALEMLNINIQN